MPEVFQIPLVQIRTLESIGEVEHPVHPHRVPRVWIAGAPATKTCCLSFLENSDAGELECKAEDFQEESLPLLS